MSEYSKAGDSPIKKFKGVKPKLVSVDQTTLIKTETFQDGGALPLIVLPAVEGVDLADWARTNQAFIDGKLTEHGAILFRGFGIESEEAFERLTTTLCSDLFKENGEHTPVNDTTHVQTPVFYAPEKKLLWHNENSFNYQWPLHIWFGCMRPADQGGETPLVDSRNVYERLDPKIVERFAQKQVMYLRNYGDGLGRTWQAVFKTDNRLEVEAICRQSRMEFEWKAGDRLRTWSIRPAVIPHPVTGALSWFNQAQHWHIACLDADTRESLLKLFAEEDLPRNCYYGDGSRIEDSIMEEILGVYRELEVSFPWQQGDVIMVDNVLVAHGRNPFAGKRRILVALGNMHSFDMAST